MTSQQNNTLLDIQEKAEKLPRKAPAQEKKRTVFTAKERSKENT